MNQKKEMDRTGTGNATFKLATDSVAHTHTQTHTSSARREAIQTTNERQIKKMRDPRTQHKKQRKNNIKDHCPPRSPLTLPLTR